MRHLRSANKKRTYWHIDTLIAAGQALEIWWHTAAERMECEWAATAARHAHSRPPCFGASDCRCKGHLLHFTDTYMTTQARDEIQQRLNGTIHTVRVSLNQNFDQ
jgi:Uri superfamily endonuclease